MTLPTVTEVLVAAKSVITDERRWTKHRMTDSRMGLRCHCSIGAVDRALMEFESSAEDVFPLYVAAVNALDEAARAATHDTFTNIVGLNDDPLTTHREVMAVFDVAIATTKETDA